MRNQIIGGIVLLILAGLFAKYKIFDDKIELKYSLSEKIPSDFDGNIREVGVQQLTIRNSGDILISSIVIKIDADVQDIKIIKFKSTDSVSISKSNNYSEILYPEIPPSGEAIVLMKITGNSIDKNKIQIFHSKGVAREAFSDKKSYGNTIFLIISFVYLIISLLGIKRSYVESLESSAKYSYLEILKRKKPWYVKDDKWVEIRNNAISYFIEKDYITTIEKSESFQLLNAEKKQFLSEEEWIKLLDTAENKIQHKIIEKTYKSYYDSAFEELSNLNKPTNISYENWKKINEAVSQAFCVHKIRDTLRFKNHYSVVDFLSSKKPDIVTEDDWINLKKILSTFYTSSIVEEGIGRIRYESYIDMFNLDILDISKKKNITDLFENIKKGFDLKEYNSQLLQVIRDMFYWEKVPNKPDNIVLDDWKKIADLYNRIVKAEREAQEKFSEAKKIKAEFEPLKEKVTKQLEIIDNLLSEPGSVEKVEVFNNPFAKGNWDNIQRISKILLNE